MKIFQINSNYGRGSTGRIAADIENLLISEGHKSLVAYGRLGDTKKAYKIGSKISIYYHVLITRVFDKHGLGSKLSTLRLIQSIKSFDPDIIHLHNIHGYYLNYEVLFDYLQKSKIRVIWTLHDCWAFTGHCTHFEYSNCQKWQTQCDNCPEKKSYPSSVILDNSSNNFNNKKTFFSKIENMTIVTPSIWLKDKVGKSFLSHYKTVVINNGVDLDTFRPRPSEFMQNFKLMGKFIILGVANVWNRRKGLQFFIELSKIIDDDMKIVLVGLSDKQLNEIPDAIIKIKRTDSAVQLAQIYSSADVYVNPTLEDTFPTTNLEALACGTPIIAFDTGGCSEVVDSNTGIIIKIKTAEKLYEAIEKVKKNKKIFYTNRCLEKAKKHYDKNERYNEYLDLYLENINEQKN